MTEQKPKILFIDDDVDFLKEATQGLKGVFEVFPCSSLDNAQERLTESETVTNCKFDLILLDLVFGQNEEDKAGIPFLKMLTKKYPHIPVIVVTQHDSFTVYEEVQQAGAKAFFVKATIDFVVWIRRIEEEIAKNEETAVQPPSDPQRNETAQETPPVRSSIPARKAKKDIVSSEPSEPAESQEKEYPFIGEHPQIVTIRNELESLSEEPDITVLLLGETGVGKEVAARYLHAQGARRNRPFRAVNLVAISTELLESTLFGHSKGSFTGAFSDSKGKFEEANGGVLFLDEIGEINGLLQQKLLRFLEDKVITPMGGQEKTVDVQIVAATNRNLKEEVAKGDFRLDLYHRLNDYSITIPPLRERREDIKKIAEYYLAKRGFDQNIFTIQIWDYFYSYSWPGNVRELVSTIKRMLLKGKMAKVEQIDASFLPLEIRGDFAAHDQEAETTTTEQTAEKGRTSLGKQTARRELQEIETALIEHRFKQKVVDALGMENLDQLRYLIKEKYFKDYPDLFRDFPTICKKYKLEI